MLEIKQKGNRYYYFNRSQMRSFPIKKADALVKIEAGEAYMVEYFITDQRPQLEYKEEIKTENKNVVSFADKLKQKQDQQEFDIAKNQFLTNILPNMSKDDMLKVLATNGDNEQFQAEMMRIMLRISIENATK